MATEPKVVSQLKAGIAQVVALSQTNQVVSNAFTLGDEDVWGLSFQVTAASVSGTAGVVKLQHSMDGTNYTDVDATNAKITVASATRFTCQLSAYNSTVAAKFPLFKFCRFVATTGGSDAFTVTALVVQLHS